MRYFKHLANERNDPKLKRIEKELGEAGYARAMKLLEIVSERGGKGAGFQPRISLEDASTDLRWLAEEWAIHPRTARVTLRVFAKVEFIDLKEWERNIIYVPVLKERLDEWARRRQSENSGATPEALLSNSPQSQKSESEEEYRGSRQSQKSDDQADHDADRPSLLRSEENNLTPDPYKGTDGDGKGAAHTMARRDPWEFLRINRTQVPRRFLGDGSFEPHFKNWWFRHCLEAQQCGHPVIPLHFAEYALDEATDQGIEYPPVLLKRKKELEREESGRAAKFRDLVPD